MLLSALKTFAAGDHDTLHINQYREFRFLYANDVYNGTDRYLTQYVQFVLLNPFRLRKNGLVTQDEFLIQQNVYTPSDIFGDTIQKHDRPYCSVLSLELHKNMMDEKRKIQFRTGMALGVIGRHGFGEDMQREVHYAVNSRQALGWKYQIHDAPYINLQAGIDKAILMLRHIDYIAHADLHTGTVFNDLSIGQSIRLHLHHHYFSFFNHSRLRSFRAYAELKNNIKLVAYNGTLQGATGSRNNPYVLTQGEISPIVSLTQISLSCAYQRLSITVSESFLSKEFKSGLKHKWGHITFSYLF